MYARITEAVFSGRSVREVPSRSSKVYISFETMSVSCADAAREKLRFFEDRSADFVVVVRAENFARDRLHAVPDFGHGGSKSLVPLTALIKVVWESSMLARACRGEGWSGMVVWKNAFCFSLVAGGADGSDPGSTKAPVTKTPAPKASAPAVPKAVTAPKPVTAPKAAAGAPVKPAGTVRPAAAKSVAAAPVTLTTDEQKTIYAIGLSIYKSLAPFGCSPAELELVKRALSDANANKPAVPLEEWGPKIQGLIATRTKVASEGYLTKAAAEPGATKTESGLIYKDLHAGDGESPKTTDTVKVNYRGTLVNGTEFDSSYKRGQPAEFALNGVIPCWTEGVQKMKVGGKAQLVCPVGVGVWRPGNPSIPGGSTLISKLSCWG